MNGDNPRLRLVGLARTPDRGQVRVYRAGSFVYVGTTRYDLRDAPLGIALAASGDEKARAEVGYREARTVADYEATHPDFRAEAGKPPAVLYRSTTLGTVRSPVVLIEEAPDGR